MDNMHKIIYFDKETINNLLQQHNMGSKISQQNNTTTFKGEGKIDIEAKVNLSVPLIKRIGFLFTGKISATYIKQRDNTITITSTEISEFRRIKGKFENFEKKLVQLKDIENSSTFLRVAGGYLRMVKGGIDDVDVKEFNSVMSSYEGYDSYKVDDENYVRFNNSAFVSNYKRNDLLISKLQLYCVLVGEFEYKEFNFLKQISKMENLITDFESNSSLADVFPQMEIKEDDNPKEVDKQNKNDSIKQSSKSKKIKLYDVVYASIPIGDKHE